MKPLALDLFCGAGGAGDGLARAGFDVIGCDIAAQPNYPFPFVQADATRPPFDLSRVALIWASPPCQAYTAMRTMHNARPHEDLIPPTRELLRAWGGLYVIENVEGAPLENPVRLCGSMFGLGAAGAQLRRHRLFEASFEIPRLACRHHNGPTIGIYGGHVRNRKRREGSHARGVADFTPAQGHEAMGVSRRMTLEELSEAIPPAYSEFIGLVARQMLLTRA